MVPGHDGRKGLVHAIYRDHVHVLLVGQAKLQEHELLLLFRKGGSRATETPHDGDGELHLAFAIPAAELDRWETWLTENGIAVEEKHKWEMGGYSLYFRDPDQHLLEVVTPGVWSIY